MWKERLKKTFIILGLGSIVVISIVFTCHYWVERSSKSKLFENTAQIEKHRVALLLGTAKFLSNGNNNLFFKYRINAAAQLFKDGKVEYILVSGDNRKMNYNEPLMMQKALIEKGVPKDRIVFDYAGLRTLDSVVRAKKIFGQSEIVIISQPFHLKRALFIARYSEIEAIGFAAKDVPSRYGLKTHLREYLARVKMVIDLFITHKEPRHLGEPVKI